MQNKRISFENSREKVLNQLTLMQNKYSTSRETERERETESDREREKERMEEGVCVYISLYVI